MSGLEGFHGILHNHPINYIYSLQAESVEMIKLTTVNLPALLTRIHCLYRLTQLTDSTHSLTDDVILQLRANGSRVGAKVVTCLLPDDIRDILLETSKLYRGSGYYNYFSHYIYYYVL